MKKLFILFIVFAIISSVSAQNNVGIGTGPPKSKVDVNGNIAVGAGYSATTAAPANGAIIQGQVGIGTATPDASAKLDIVSTSQGVSFPNVAIASVTDNTTIVNPVKGLVIFNPGTIYGTAGLYYNTAATGSTPNWVRLGDANTGVQALGVVAPIQSTGGTNPTISMPQANGSTNGFLASSDWTTFNNKLSTSLSNGRVWIGDGTNTAQPTPITGDATLSNAGVITLRNTGTAGVYGSATQVPVLTTDAQGRITGVTLTTITGTSPVGSTLNSGQLWVGNSANQAAAVTPTGDATISNAGAITLKNTGTAGNYGSASSVPVITTDAQGRVNAVTNTSIAINGSAVSGNITGNAAGFTGSLLGDVTGGQASTSLSKIQGTTLTVSSLNNKDVLQYNGTNWANAPATTVLNNSTSHTLSLSGTTITSTVNSVAPTLNIAPAIAAVEPWYVGGGTTAATANTQNIYQAGNVGIGASTGGDNNYLFSSVSPAAPLVVAIPGAATAASTPVATGIRIGRSGTSGTKYPVSADVQLGSYGTTGSSAQSQLNIKLGNGNTSTPDVTVMSLLGNGNVGIGNTSPNAKLDINGSQLINGNLTNSSARPSVSSGTLANGELRGYSASGITADDGFLRVSAGGGTTAGIKSYIDLSGYNAGGTGNDMYENIALGTAGTERMRILYNGNVGIGTNNPVNKLQVEGNMHMDGHSIYFRTGPTDTYDFIQWGGITGGSGNDRMDIAGYSGVDLGYSSVGGAISTVLSVNGSNQVTIPGLAASSAVYTDASHNLTTTAPTGGLNWATTGNTGTTPTSYNDGAAQTNNFMGTTDNQPLFIYTNSSSGNNKSNVELYNATSTTSAAVASSDIFHIRRNGQTGVSYPQVVSFALGKYAAGINSLTQADIKVGNGGTYVPDVTVMSLLGNGNVGIGATSPNDKLEVNGNIRLTGGGSIYAPNQTGGGASGGAITVEGGNAVFSSSCAYGGNVNLIAGNMNSDGSNCAGSTNAPASGNVNIRAGANQFSNVVNGNIFFYAGESATGQSQANQLRMMIVGDNGNVGIGNSAPAYLLDVANSGRFNNGGGTYVYVGNGGGGYYGDASNLVTQIPTGGSFYMSNTGTDGTRVSQSDGTLRVGGPSQGSSNLYVYGKEGIGTTSPGYTLDINGKTGIDGANDGAIYMNGTKNTYHGIEWNYGSNDRYGMAQATGGNTALYTSAAYGAGFISFNLANAYTSAFTELARITHAGSMGIGTTAPNWKLDVAGSIGIANNNGSSTNRLYLASGDNNHYIYSSGTSGNQMYFGEYSNFNFVNTSSGSTVMDIAGSYVGIGTTSPNCPLDVEAVNNTFNENSYRWFANSGSGTNTASCSSCNVAIYTPNRIEAAEFDATSDRRIKKNITSQPLPRALDEAMRLRVVTFNYIDQIQKGNKTKTGFIAQEVEDVLPNAVNHDIGFIPNVFQAPVKTELKGNTLTVTTDKTHDFAKGDEIRIYDMHNQSHDVMVSRVNNPNEFVVNGWSDNADSLFVYGKQVDDYRNVDFDQITAISIGAVQQLDAKVKALEDENACLKEQNAKLNSVKANTEDVNVRFSQMKAQLDDLKLLMEKNGIRSDK